MFLLVYQNHIDIYIECTDKKEKKIFLMYKEIQNGAVAKSYITKFNFLFYQCAGNGRLQKPGLTRAFEHCMLHDSGER